MKKYFILIFCLVFLLPFAYSQNNNKIPLTHSFYDGWKNVSANQISNNGNFVSYEVNPQKGDGWLFLWDALKNKLDSFPRGYKAMISPSSDFFIYRIKPPESLTRKAKKEKKKKDDLPKDSLAIYFIQKDTTLKFERIKSFSVPKENPAWIAFYLEKELKKAKKDSTSTADSSKKNEKKPDTKSKKTPKEKKEPGTRLVLINTTTLDTISYPRVTEYFFSKKGNIVSFVQTNKDTIDTTNVLIFNTKQHKSFSIFHSPGIIKNITCSELGDAVAFLHSTDTCENKTFSLKIWTDGEKTTRTICDTANINIPKGWSPSVNLNPWFSSDGTKIYFGTATRPVNLPKDTLLDEEKCNVDVWHWDEPQMQPEQLKDLDKEKKKTFTAVYHLKTNKVIQLADTLFDQVSIPFKGNGKYGLALSEINYEKTSTWDFPTYHDYSLIDLETGQKTPIAKKVKYNIAISPGEKYFTWFSDIDSSWYLRPLLSEKAVCLSKKLKVPFYNEDDDKPNPPDAWGSAGWLQNDEAFFIYDRYDVWKIDPLEKTAPETITNGRKNKTRFRFENTDPEKNFIDKKEPILLHVFNETTKNEGYYSYSFKSKNISSLIEKAANVNFEKKADKSPAILWTESTYNLFPDLRYSKNNFQEPKVISNANPQQSKYLWGSAETYKWKAFDGKELEGLLYKPENFDPAKKYPMIVYFYEKHSNELFRHYTPRASRSVINFTYYTSNGYLIFVPDIKYGLGHPGKDSYNCIISGVESLCKNPWVDKKHLGLQGQSWGGYQIAYLVTKTDTLFAAAMAGAPVSNMTSAYGGIRWESGKSRISQYEKGQSRIGVTLWDSLSLYIENSPLFYAPAVKTPLLIMSNDGDGAVPWYQGIEYYSALRRLEKPCWLLNYNGDEHNLGKRPNMIDLTIRMQQFFDHYLKESPAPDWMTKGVPAIKKGIDNGLKISQ